MALRGQSHLPLSHPETLRTLALPLFREMDGPDVQVPQWDIQETDYVQWSGAPACSASVECGAQVLSSSHVPQRAWGNCGAAREVGVRDECGGQSLHHGFVVTISLVAAVLGESVWLDLLSGREGLPCPDVAPGIQRRKPHRFRCSLRASMFSLIRKRNRSRLPSKVAYRVTRMCPVLFLHTGPLNCP